MTIKSDRSECVAAHQYLDWYENGQPSQMPNYRVSTLQTQLQGQLVNVRPQYHAEMFRLVRNAARRLMRESGFSDPVADIGPADYEPMPGRVLWTVAPSHDIYMTASGLQYVVDGTASDFQSDDPKLLCAVNLGMVWLIRDETTLHRLIKAVYQGRTNSDRLQQ